MTDVSLGLQQNEDNREKRKEEEKKRKKELTNVSSIAKAQHNHCNSL